jgi:hypothetical protein
MGNSNWRIEDITVANDIDYCVDMYLALNDNTFMVADRTESIRHLFMKVRMKRFVKVYKEDNRILAWIYGDRVKLDHCNYTNFQQIYYCSDQYGFKAYRCLVALHDSLYKHSINTDALYCVSPGSPLDPTNVLARSLEKNGWMRRGYIAARRIERPATGTAPARYQVGRW